MQEKIASAKMPGGWRRTKLVAGGAAVTLAAFGSLTGVAYGVTPTLTGSTLESATYVIGTAPGSPTNVSASASNTTGGDTSLYTVTFKSPDGSLGNANTITLTESDTAGGIFAAVTSPSDVVVEDASNVAAYPPQHPTSVTVTGATMSIVLGGGTASIPAGDTILVQFTTTNPTITSSTAYTIGVSTSADNTTANASPITLSAGAAAASVSASLVTLGSNALYTFSNILVGGSGNTTEVELESSGSTPSTLWNNAVSGYTVTDTPSGGTAHSVTVSSISGGNTADVTLTLGSSIAAGDTLNITAYGANPTTSGATDSYALAFPASTTVTAPTIPSTILFGSSVSNVTVTPSPASASSSSTYIVSFKAATAIPNTGTVDITLPSDTTITTPANAVVTDPTSGLLNSTATVAAGTHSPGHEIVVTPDIAIAAGDTVDVTFTGVTNPSTTETESSATVSTSTDVIPATAANYAIGVSTSGAPQVSVSPNTPGVTATYTISGFTSTGLTAGTGQLELLANAGTIFPAVASDYTISDSTNASGSGTATAVALHNLTGPNGATGGANNDAVITVPNTVNSGDHLTITVADVINPASGNQNLDVVGNVGSVTLPLFPTAGVTYPNGAIVNFGGTYYVFAGGHAFGFPTVKSLTNVQTVDHAVVQTAASGVTVPTSAARVGTLINVYGNSTIYVVGSDGMLHGFATPTQLLQDGYDGALVITVPNMGGMTVSTSTVGQLGTAANALAYSSDGAVVNSSGTFYVFAGGKAFGIPTPTALTNVLKGNPYSTPLTGTISTTATSATMANGVVVTVNNGVWVSYNSSLYAFKSANQLSKDGYSGTPAVIVPNAGGLSAVTSYAGS